MAEIDQTLIRYADTLSLNALSFKIEGILSPEQCGARLVQLLDSPDWLTAVQQDQLITHKMRLAIIQLEEQLPSARNVEVLVNALEKLGNRLEKRVAANEADLSKLYAFQGQVLMETIDEVLAYMRGVVTDGNTVAAEQWDAALETAIRRAQIKLSSYEDAPSKEVVSVGTALEMEKAVTS